jgi:hypothetical protein
MFFATRSNGVTLSGSATNASPFIPSNSVVSGSGVVYPRGLGGATDLCTLYGRPQGFNPCGGAVAAGCENHLLQILIAIALLALLFLRPAAGSQ